MGRLPIPGKQGGWPRPPPGEAQPQTFQPALEPAPHRAGIRVTLLAGAVGDTLLQGPFLLSGQMFGLLAGGEAVVPAGNQPARQHGQSQVAEFADSAMNADLGMLRIMGLTATPSMPNDGSLLACRTNANHLARLAFGVIPCDKYNHCGGEGPFWITARTLSGWPPSPPTESQIHLEEKPHLLPPRIRNLILAGKPVTAPQKFLAHSSQSLAQNAARIRPAPPLTSKRRSGHTRPLKRI